ncbi:unnamed protein product [Effrenium voratum]|nr:unnamed protein product [Effrenium voratum]
MAPALTISGATGINELTINGTYEPMEIAHHEKPCWVSRKEQPLYLFHVSQDNRWVISKSIDDGAHCWAYLLVKEGGADPAACSGDWVAWNEEHRWAPLPVKCSSVPAEDDQFVRLRRRVDTEMRKYGMVDPTHIKELWKRLDYNGNNIVSLAEIDKLTVDLVSTGAWPAWLNNKPALMRAYRKTTLKAGGVEKNEFHALLLNIFWFNKLWQVYDSVDTSDDRRIDLQEFTNGLAKLDLKLSDAEAQKEFGTIDSNHGGKVLFVEFCAWARKRINPDACPNFDADLLSGQRCVHALRHEGHSATQENFITKKCLREFDELEAEIKELVAQPRKFLALWRLLDFNGNGIVSLAEIDRLVVDQYPLLNHKPALMRAYQKTISKPGGGDGDAWVEKKEFKTLLVNLFYFNKISWIFEQGAGIDMDRRMTLEDFRRVLVLCGCSMTDAEAKKQFEAMDRNHGGLVLLDEFCSWFASSSCPEGMTSLVG